MTAKVTLERAGEAVFARGGTVLTIACGSNDIGWGTNADEAHRWEHPGFRRDVPRLLAGHSERYAIAEDAKPVSTEFVLRRAAGKQQGLRF